MMTKSLLYLPPDADLQSLAKKITTRIEGSGRVDFYSIQKDGDQNVGYAIIFQAGSKRLTIQLRGRPTENDIDDIVKGHQSWSGGKASAPLYTTEMPSEGMDYI